MLIPLAYIVALALFGFGAVWSDHKRHPILADWLGVAWFAILVFGLLII